MPLPLFTELSFTLEAEQRGSSIVGCFGCMSTRKEFLLCKSFSHLLHLSLKVEAGLDSTKEDFVAILNKLPRK